MKISLMVISAGKAAGKALPINVAQFIIGRDPQCNLRPASAMISKRHCAVLVKDGQVFLRDFGSTNGTFVNDQQIKGEVPLKDGDILKAGPLSFKVVIEGAPAPVPAAPVAAAPVAAAPKKLTPPPKPKSASVTDDDAAAALLSIEEVESPAEAPSPETAEDQVPGGTTVMDIPAFKPEEPEAAPAEPPADP